MLTETNITKKVTVLYFKVFWKSVKATTIIRLSNDYSIEQLRKNQIDASKNENANVRQKVQQNLNISKPSN